MEITRKKRIPRPYQVQAIGAVNDAIAFDGIQRPILVMATGTGKTATTTEIVRGKKTLWLTHTEELISQSAYTLLDSLELDESELEVYNSSFYKTSEGDTEQLDIIEFLKILHSKKGSAFDSPAHESVRKKIGVIKRDQMHMEANYIVASIQTIHNRLDKIDPHFFDFIVVDECHYCLANTWTKTINHFKNTPVLGLTATPYRTDGMELTNLFDKIVFEYPIEQAIQEGNLCEISAQRIRTEISLDNVRTTAGELNSKDLRVVDNPIRNKLIVDSYEKYAKGRKFLFFGVDVEHTKNVCLEFKKRGYNVAYIVGEDEESVRKNKIRALKSGRLDGATNCMVLTTGFDDPAISCIIMGCPTKSKVKFFQIVGRGTRLKPEYIQFKDLLVIDMIDVTKRHSLINTKTLDEGKSIDDKLFMNKEKKKKLKDKLAEPRQTKLEGKLTTKDKKVDLLKIPKVVIRDTEAMREEATPKQLELLRILGYDIDTNAYTKGMASVIIGGQQASESQMNYLKNLGFDTSNGCTKAEAAAAIEMKNKEKGIQPEWKSNPSFSVFKELANSNKIGSKLNIDPDW